MFFLLFVIVLNYRSTVIQQVSEYEQKKIEDRKTLKERWQRAYLKSTIKSRSSRVKIKTEIPNIEILNTEMPKCLIRKESIYLFVYL